MKNIYNKPHSIRGLVKLVEMDEKVKLLTQMESNVVPVILINKFSVETEEPINS
jgi:hypothetical protein